MVLLTNESKRAIHDVLSLRQNLRASDNENAEISPKDSKIRCKKNKLAIISAVVWLAITTDIAKHVPMNPSRRIARDLKACIVAGPILLLMWVLKGCE
jgi:hypothetical protein